MCQNYDNRCKIFFSFLKTTAVISDQIIRYIHRPHFWLHCHYIGKWCITNLRHVQQNLKIVLRNRKETLCLGCGLSAKESVVAGVNKVVTVQPLSWLVSQRQPSFLWQSASDSLCIIPVISLSYTNSSFLCIVTTEVSFAREQTEIIMHISKNFNPLPKKLTVSLTMHIFYREWGLTCLEPSHTFLHWKPETVNKNNVLFLFYCVACFTSAVSFPEAVSILYFLFLDKNCHGNLITHL